MIQTDFTAADHARFIEYRAKLFALIERALQIDSWSKSYEGRLMLHFPGYLSVGGQESAGILYRSGRPAMELACYVLGPSRQYAYEADTWAEVFAQAEADLVDWAKDLEH